MPGRVALLVIEFSLLMIEFSSNLSEINVRMKESVEKDTHQ